MILFMFIILSYCTVIFSAARQEQKPPLPSPPVAITASPQGGLDAGFAVTLPRGVAHYDFMRQNSRELEEKRKKKQEEETKAQEERVQAHVPSASESDEDTGKYDGYLSDEEIFDLEL